MIFFQKYKIQINIVLLFFWLYVLYEGVTAPFFSVQKLIVPIAFIVLTLLNIYKGIVSNKQKSEK
jgi:hypothetical protein